MFLSKKMLIRNRVIVRCKFIEIKEMFHISHILKVTDIPRRSNPTLLLDL